MKAFFYIFLSLINVSYAILEHTSFFANIRTANEFIRMADFVASNAIIFLSLLIILIVIILRNKQKVYFYIFLLSSVFYVAVRVKSFFESLT
ncbi:MAG: hypothetical protein ABIA04_04960 [Pseudomonadota bacterium]